MKSAFGNDALYAWLEIKAMTFAKKGKKRATK